MMSELRTGKVRGSLNKSPADGQLPGILGGDFTGGTPKPAIRTGNGQIWG